VSGRKARRRASTAQPAGQLPVEDERFAPAVAMLRRTGAAEFQVRYCDEEKPVLWMAVARWGQRWEASAALGPVEAVFRLCDEVIDGGTCQHCHRPTGFEPSTDPMPLDALVCWYQYDPSTKAFVRGCAA
jgi:hypothetical protein